MAKSPKTPKAVPARKPTVAKAPVKPAISPPAKAGETAPKAVAKAPPPKVKAPTTTAAKPAAELPVEPAVLTAAEALNAARAATGEPAPAARKARSAAPQATAPKSKIAPEVTAPAVADAPAEPTVAAPAEVPVVAAEPTEIASPVERIETIKETVLEPAEEPAPAHAEGTAVMTDVIESTKKFAEDTKAKFETAFADLNVKAKAGVEKSTKALGELSDLTKGNVEAFVESGKIAAKGVEALGQDAAEYSRKNFEKATATIKSFASIKSPTEFFQLQSELVSSAFDAFAKETAKNSEAILKLAGEVAQPISSRVSLVTEKVKSLAA